MNNNIIIPEQDRKILPAVAFYEVEGIYYTEKEALNILKNFIGNEKILKLKNLKSIDEKEAAFKSLYSLYKRNMQAQTSSRNLEERIDKCFDRAAEKARKMRKDRINFVVAIDNFNCIGKNNKLPWKQKTDLEHVKELTLGHILVMGEKTFESVGALPNREIRVLSRNPDKISNNPNVVYYRNYNEAIQKNRGDKREIFIFGGAQIYSLYFSKMTDLYITFVDTIVDGGDAYFPHIPVRSFDTRETKDFKSDENNEYDMKICHLRKFPGHKIEVRNVKKYEDLPKYNRRK